MSRLLSRPSFAFLDRARSVAPEGFSRWRVPPAALAIHLSIGQAYAFSVLAKPLAAGTGPATWTPAEVGWVFSVAIVTLGLTAAFLGGWVERTGPRRAMALAALCFPGGLLLGALGVATHQLWLLVLGYGVVGGFGLGLGYLAPVTTLLAWFPDRPGLASGLAIMGFGGGAMLAAPLSVRLMAAFAGPAGPGVWQTLAALAALYLVPMTVAAATVRVPAEGWAPPGAVAPKAAALASVSARSALRRPAFWLLWAMLCLNTTAGIAVLSQASPMLQELLPGRVGAAGAAAFVALLSLCNMLGRFGWSALSDRIGRRATFLTFFGLGALCFATAAVAGRAGLLPLTVGALALALTMYGGGFATIPPYVKDVFGPREAGPIYGRLLTAWSAAAVLGHLLVDAIRAHALASGATGAGAHGTVLLSMGALLGVGVGATLLVRRQPEVTGEVTGEVTVRRGAVGERSVGKELVGDGAVGGPQPRAA